MRMPKSYWPEYLALILFVSGPILLMIFSFIVVLK